MKRNFLIDLFWRIHPRLYRLSDGRIGGQLMGLPVLLLTTTGRKSGLLRTKALMYLPYGEACVVFASNLGESHHPAWWLNLETDPTALLQIGADRYPVKARLAEGEERAELWMAVTERTPQYNAYQARTARRIPVVVLDRK